MHNFLNLFAMEIYCLSLTHIYKIKILSGFFRNYFAFITVIDANDNNPSKKCYSSFENGQNVKWDHNNCSAHPKYLFNAHHRQLGWLSSKAEIWKLHHSARAKCYFNNYTAPLAGIMDGWDILASRPEAVFLFSTKVLHSSSRQWTDGRNRENLPPRATAR